MMHRCLGLALSAALLAAAPVPAAMLLQSEALDARLSAPSSLAFDPFDPTLGTLTEARISISGVMMVQAFAPIFGDATGGFIPYSFSIRSSLSAISPGGFGFEFGSPATWLAPFSASGIGETLTETSAFSLEFGFDALSELTGFTTPGGSTGLTQPPVPINGQLSGFLATPVSEALGIQQSFFLAPFPQVLGAPVPVTVVDASFQGTVELIYLYEAHRVPEPGSLALLALTLVLGTVLHARRLVLSR